MFGPAVPMDPSSWTGSSCARQILACIVTFNPDDQVGDQVAARTRSNAKRFINEFFDELLNPNSESPTFDEQLSSNC